MLISLMSSLGSFLPVSFAFYQDCNQVWHNGSPTGCYIPGTVSSDYSTTASGTGYSPYTSATSGSNYGQTAVYKNPIYTSRGAYYGPSPGLNRNCYYSYNCRWYCCCSR